jgi:hypothetical protein
MKMPPKHNVISFVLMLAAASLDSMASAPVPTVPPEIAMVRDDAGIRVMFTGDLQLADTPAGPWMDAVGAVTPYIVSTNRTVMAFRAVERKSQMRVKIGSRTFAATLDDNPAARAFKAMLPMTIDMTELNGNEKYADLPTSLPTNASNPGTIKSGDLMVYGSRVLVLFYETFFTSYSYTKLGRIEDVTGLAAALGSAGVKVAFELE